MEDYFYVVEDRARLDHHLREQHLACSQYEIHLEIYDQVRRLIFEIEALLCELEIGHGVRAQGIVQQDGSDGAHNVDVMFCAEALQRNVSGGKDHGVAGRSWREPVAAEGAQQSHDDRVEEREDQNFVDEGEEEHRVRENCRHTSLRESQPILEYVSNALNS